MQVAALQELASSWQGGFPLLRGQQHGQQQPPLLQVACARGTQLRLGLDFV